MMEPLTVSYVHAAMENACAFFRDEQQQSMSCQFDADEQSTSTSTIQLRRAQTSDLSQIRKFLNDGNVIFDPMNYSSAGHQHETNEGTFVEETCSFDIPNFFGFILEEASKHKSSEEKEKDPSSRCCCCVGIVTFQMAYSSWDGRILQLDKMLLLSDESSSTTSSSQDDLTGAFVFTLQRTLAYLALELQCARYVWQHERKLPRYPDSTWPESLHETLTLQLDCKQQHHNISDDNTQSKDPSSVTVNKCLEEMQTLEDNFTLRLSTIEDLEAIENMVKGLAIFVNEPDAVHINRNHYFRDGYSQEHPLFYCLILEDCTSKATSQTDVNGEPRAVCAGMAFYYLGYTFGDGRFLYLEDLYVDETYRGNGAGTSVMKALITIAHKLDCSRMVWQALDWNKPALAFYEKLGARVRNGLMTSRFAGDDLHKFVHRNE